MSAALIGGRLLRLAVVAAIIAAFSAPVTAQVGNDPLAPPVFPMIDQNGVELRSGKLVRPLASISIGPGGPGSLSYIWSTDMWQQAEIWGYIRPQTTSQGKMVFAAVIGGTTETFSSVENANASHTLTQSQTLTQDQGRSSTLVYDHPSGTFTYTRTDGAVAIFNKPAIGGNPASSQYKIVSLTYPAGQVLHYYYVYNPFTDNLGFVEHRYDVKSVTSNLGYQLRLTYNASDQGRVASVVMFNMRDVTCDPQAASCTIPSTWPRLTRNAATGEVTDNLGRTVKFASAVITLPSGRQLTYSSYGQIASFTDGKGTWNYAYPGGGAATVITSPGSTVPDVIEWDTASGRPAKITPRDPSITPVTAFTYDDKHRTTKVTLTDSTGAKNETHYVYDTRGNVTQTIAVSTTPGTPANIVRGAGYPATCTNPKTCNKPQHTVDELGNTTLYTYDGTHGQLTKVTFPSSQSGTPQIWYTYQQHSARYRGPSGTTINGSPIYLLTKISRCATGPTSCDNSANETRETIIYGVDDALMPTSRTIAAGDGTLSATTTYSYTSLGNVETQDGPLTGTDDQVRYYYDGLRRLTGQIGPDPDDGGTLQYRAVRTTYHPDGGVAKVEAGTASGQTSTSMAGFSPLEARITEYDAQGRVGLEKFVSGGTTSDVRQYSYTGTGQIECLAQRMNPAEFASLPASACTPDTPHSTHGPDRITRYTYNLNGQPTNVETGVGTADQINEATTYNAHGAVATVSDGNLSRTTYDYDGFRRLRRINFPHPVTANVTSSYEEFGYDASSNVVTFRNRAGETVTRQYTAARQMYSESGSPSAAGRSFTYDNLGRLTHAAVAGGQTHQFVYDALGRQTKEIGPLGTVESRYDLSGERYRLIWPGGFSIDFDRDDTGAITRIREKDVTTGQGVLASFASDQGGRRTQLSRGNGATTTYVYDDEGWFTSISHNLSGSTQDQTITFGHNQAAQVVTRAGSNNAYDWSYGSPLDVYNITRSYASNRLNQVTQAGSLNIGYTDARGNVTSSGTDTFHYDHLNRLVSASTSHGSATLAYDPLDRLYSTTSGSVVTRFLYDGSDIIAEYDGAGNVLRRYVHGPNDDEPLAWYEGSGTASRRWLIADELGSIVAVTNSSAVVTTVNLYDPYGNPAVGNAMGGRFQYTGQIWLPEIGLYHYKARVYSPALGRFMQPDPIGYDDGLNIYAYVGNDPANGWDPTGLCNPDGSPTWQGQDCSDIVINGQGERLQGQNLEEYNTQRRIDDLIQGLREVGSIAIGFTPYGTVVDVGNALAGRDLITGERLSGKDRLLGLLPGMSEFRKTRNLAGLAKRLGCGCFVAGTLVATPGGLVAIETIEIGDEVLAFDEATGDIAPKLVTDLIRPDDKPLFEVRLRAPQGNIEVFHATDDHPWKVEQKGWIETVNLSAGDQVATASGSEMVVLSLIATGRVEQTYTLTVADWHTFFVGEGRVLVHNACPVRGPRAYRGQLRQEVMAKNGGKCVYCDKLGQHADHRKPYAQGGKTTLENGDPTCAQCNLAKGNRTPDRWLGK